MKFSRTKEAVEWLVAQAGADLRVATPLALGKPNVLLNELYTQVKANLNLRLTLFTALSLGLPKGDGALARRFLEPFVNRIYGPAYPELLYLQDLRQNQLPKNIHLQEFYIQAGLHLRDPQLQSHYNSLNYTHVARTLCNNDINIIVQLVAKRGAAGKEEFSLSCNPDLTLDLRDRLFASGKKFIFMGVVHPELPFLEGDAVLSAKDFDAILESPESNHKLFSLPRTPIQLQDHWIGFWSSQLLRDDGTLQIGIGSLAEAVVHSLIFRQRENTRYQDVCRQLWGAQGRQLGDLQAPSLIGARRLDFGPFHKGLYGTSEMIMDGFMHLRRAGILTRTVNDLVENRQRFLHGAFFLGSPEFYEYLRGLSDSERAGIGMSRVSAINDLYDRNELTLRRQRKNGRFLNTCMQATILGGAASDTLPTGEVVSGVGGQYNFVAMSQEMDDAMSILMLRSQRQKNGEALSNLVTGHPHLTIPRHLRDVFVTEYGIAVVQGADEETTCLSLIQIADLKFQDELLRWARNHKKIQAHAKLAAFAKDNTFATLHKKTVDLNLQTHFVPFPFGSDFTPEEERLALALGRLQNAQNHWSKLAKFFLQGSTRRAEKFSAELHRMKLATPQSARDWIWRRLLISALDPDQNSNF